MSERTAIAWTEKTWNPWQGCRKVSPGCKLCYMYREKTRYGQDPKTVVRSKPATFNAPLRWKAAALVFTCSWSDWFIEEADAWRDEAWEIVKRTPWLKYQILTKRPERIAAHLPAGWPLPNVWLGVSVENQAAADERIPELLGVLGAVRFVSCEPLLGPVDLTRIDAFRSPPWPSSLAGEPKTYLDALRGEGLRPSWTGVSIETTTRQRLSWVIVGGESGPNARACDLVWIRSLVAQCKAASVPAFVKQLGTWPHESPGDPMNGWWPRGTRFREGSNHIGIILRDRKGGNPAEWPTDLRVRQFPESAA